MQFKKNAEVVTSEGEKVGRIDRVVIDPNSRKLTHLVVKKGFLFTKDKVVPLDLFESTMEDRLVLKGDVGDLDDFPDFEETHYLPLEEARTSANRDPDRISPLVWYYPLPRRAWWRMKMSVYPGFPEPPILRITDFNIPNDTVPLEKGANVVSGDGNHVGDVERVYVEEEEQRVTHLLISQGLISKSRKLITSMWVDRVFEDEVRLSISKAFIEELPEYSTQD